MPFASEEVIASLEEKIANFTSITDHLNRGDKPEEIIRELMGDFDVSFQDKIPTSFYCNCSKERISKAIVSIGKEEIQKMIDEGNDIEVNCHFCNSHYNLSVEELKELLAYARS
jgi:molecular chaperone Hsp33